MIWIYYEQNDGGGFNSLQIAPGSYDEQVFQNFDYVLAVAVRVQCYLAFSPLFSVVPEYESGRLESGLLHFTGKT